MAPARPSSSKRDASRSPSLRATLMPSRAVSSLWASGRAIMWRYGCRTGPSGLARRWQSCASARCWCRSTRGFALRTLAYVLGQSDSSTLIIAARSGPTDYLDMARQLLPTLGLRWRRRAASKATGLAAVIVLGDGTAPGTIAWSSLLAAGPHVSNDAFALGSRPSTRTQPPSSSIPPEPRIPEGRDALSHHCSQRRRSCLPHGHHAIGYHPHVPAALSLCLGSLRGC